MSNGNIYIYGAPASGKSTLGKALAEKIGADFTDLDAVIVERAGMPIPEIFALYNKFRQTYMAPPAKMAYRAATKDRGRASDCVSCGQCMAECPQNLEIPALLKECTDLE